LIWREVTWEEEWGPYNEEPMKGNIVVDGGILSNFPLNLVAQANHPLMNILDNVPARALGFLLDEEKEVPKAGGGPARAPATDSEGDPTPLMVKRATRLIDTMSGARDLEIIDRFKASVCRLPAKSYGVVEFDMPRERLEALVKAGHDETAAFVRALPGR
jgi:predicted acylesterase/phospholipase RssA